MVRLLPSDERFFDLLDDLAGRLEIGARGLRMLFAEPPRREALAEQIHLIEHEADDVAHEIAERAAVTFVTPFDREDIHELARRLDRVVDLVDGTARRARTFEITTVPEGASRLAGIVQRMSEEIAAVVRDLRRPPSVLERVHTAKVLEEEGNAVYAEAISALFASQPDPLHVLKWKELPDRLEDTIDECQCIVGVLESMALKCT